MGPSGSGKTTLLKTINGLETSTGGEIYFDNKKVNNNNRNISSTRRKAVPSNRSRIEKKAPEKEEKPESEMTNKELREKRTKERKEKREEESYLKP